MTEISGIVLAFLIQFIKNSFFSYYYSRGRGDEEK